MNIAIRLFLGFFLVVGLAAWFVLHILVEEVKPGVRQATEDTLVDTAHLLAELAAPELAKAADRPEAFADGPFSQAVAAALRRSPRASIWGVDKNRVDSRIYVTDAQGIVRYDSSGLALGADYSQWRDVFLALRGQYGARSSRERPDDPDSSVMYVAAPIEQDGRIVGVVAVAKPGRALAPYIARATERVERAGLGLLALATLIGLLFTAWLTVSLNRLRDYARAVSAGRRAVAPTGGGRQLSELAAALAEMRARLDGKQYVEHYVASLTHELKSPLTALRGAAELLAEAPPEAQRQRFVRHILEQSARMEQIVGRLLVLARLEQLQAPEHRCELGAVELVERACAARREALAARGLRLTVDGDTGLRLRGDPFLLEQALTNLLDNALAFAPPDSLLSFRIARGDKALCRIALGDQGPGAPDYALEHLFERFYSLPAPGAARTGSGLGLAFVREIARLHGGEAGFANRDEGGGLAWLTLPRAGH